MADGYSDKSISPVIYTPTVDTGLNLNNAVIDGYNIPRLSISSSKLVHNINNDKIPIRKRTAMTISSGEFIKYSSYERIHIFRTALGTWLMVCHYGILRSTDDKVTWSRVNTTSQGGEFLQLSTSRILTNTFYSDDDGATWTKFNIFPPAYNSTVSSAPCRSPITGTLIGGLDRGSLSFTLSRSTNNGTSFSTITVTDRVLNGYYDPYCVFCTANGTFLVGTQQDGIYRSTDDGLTFTKITTAAVSLCKFFQHSNGTIYAASPFIIYKSTDDGATWSANILPTTMVFPPPVKELGNDVLFLGSYGVNPQSVWSYLIKADNTRFTMGSLIGTNVGISMSLSYPNVTSFMFSCEHDGVIYTPFLYDLKTIGWLETDLRPITYANLPTFKPTDPAKLSEYGPVTITLDTTGSNGTITALVEHKNDEIGEWSSLTDVEGEKTSLGSVTSGVPITLPTFESRAGEEFRLTLGFQSNDAILPAPSVVNISIPWASDVESPDVPTLLDFVDTTKVSAGYRIDFGDLPTGARHIIMEGKLNDGDYLPFSNKAKFEVTYNYMRFRGAVDEVEAQGERNESHIDFRKGLEIGDVVSVKIASEDAVGNRSAFVQSSQLVLSGVTYVPVLTSDWTETWNSDVWRETWTL